MFKKLGNFFSAIGDLLTKSPLAKFLRHVGSILYGIPIGIAATALNSTLYILTKAAEISHIHVFSDFFGQIQKDDATWKLRLEKVEGFFSKIWSGFGLFTALKVTKYIGEKIEKKQSELGFGDSSDRDQNSKENQLATGPDEDFKKDLKKDLEKLSPTLAPKPLSAEQLKKENEKNLISPPAA